MGLMVENFTTVDENAYENVVNEDEDTVLDENLEEHLKRGLVNFTKEPSQKSIDFILNYSKSLNK